MVRRSDATGSAVPIWRRLLCLLTVACLAGCNRPPDDGRPQIGSLVFQEDQYMRLVQLGMRDSAEKLHAMGYRIAIYPAVGFLTVAAALERAYTQLKTDGHSNNLPADASYGFGRMCELMGFKEVWDFDRKWAEIAGNLPPQKAAE